MKVGFISEFDVENKKAWSVNWFKSQGQNVDSPC
jgi:hypothetical protein